jgi:mRNA interferase YafQ
MLKPIYIKLFRKQFKLMQKRGLDIDKLTDVMKMIINEQSLPPERKNHPLHGEWKGMFECHIEPNWLLIYEIDKSAKEVTFHRTGSHSDLF